MDLSEYILEPLRKNDEFILFRGQHRNPDQATRSSILLMTPMSSHRAPSSLRQIEHKCSLSSELDMAWAVRPIGIVQYDGQPVLVLENPGGESLDALMRQPMKTGQLLRIALVKAFDEIKRLNDRLQDENVILRQQVDPPNDPVLEIKRLQRCMNDLISVLALPVVWRGREPAEILVTFVESLIAMLDLDFFYARVIVKADERPIEVLRVGPSYQTSQQSDQIAQLIAEWLKEKQVEPPWQARRQIENREIVFLPMQMGLEGELGCIITGSHRASFPEQTESLILTVAANQAAIGIQQAQLFDEQKRVARELDDRITQRTAELEAANEVLRKEITDRKEIEERLRESEAFLLDAQQLSHTGSWKHDLATNKVSVTPEFERIFAMTAQDHASDSFSSRIHPEDRAGEMANYARALTEKRGFESDYRIVLPDGSIKYIHNVGHPRLNQDGEVLGFTGTAIDLTEQHKIRSDLQKAHAEIERSEAKLWQVIDTIPVIAWCNLPDGPNEFLNKRWTEHTGMPFEESHGWGWTDAMHPDDLPVLIKKWQAAMISGQPDEVEGRFRRYDGVYRWFLIRAEPFRDESGKIVRWYGTSTDIDDRKRAEDELKRSEARYRVVVETANDAVISINESGIIILANPATKRIFGHDTAELIGKPLAVLMPAAFEELRRSGFHRNLDTGEIHLDSRGTEFVALRAHGEEFPVEVSFEEMISGGHRIFTGFIRDISDKKRAEEAILASERNLSLTINTMPVLAWTARPDGSVEFVNERWLNYSGLSPREAEGWGWTTVFHPDDLVRLTEYWLSILATGEPGEIEVRQRRFDGEYRWFLIRGNPLRDDSGAIVRWYGTNTDIHDRKLAEEQALRSEASLAEAQHLARLGSFSWRVATSEINWSEQLYRIFEFDPGISVTLYLIGSRFHPEDLPLLDDMIRSAQDALTDLEYEHRLLMPNGSIKYLHLVAHASRDHEGQLEYIGAIQDVTQRQLAEAALAKARSELANVTRITSLGVLTASIAHEVNQPLSGIITNAGTCLRMLNSDPPNLDGARETVRRTIRDGSRASDVISRLRGLFGKKEVAAEPVDLNEATREVIALSLSELQRHRVMLQLEFAGILPPLKGDRIQLQQVILNLLRNAAEAMSGVEDRPRRLLIRTEQEAANVRLTVQDSGTGLATTDAERLFESFYTTKQDGMGIGLSISRSIIEAHRGRLWAEANDGPGATFAFSIPFEHIR